MVKKYAIYFPSENTLGGSLLQPEVKPSAGCPQKTAAINHPGSAEKTNLGTI
jgi:hypothetical protein